MFRFLTARATEPSSYAGIGLVLTGANQIVQSPWLAKAAAVADAAAQGAASGNGWLGIGLAVAGTVAALAKDPGSFR